MQHIKRAPVRRLPAPFRFRATPLRAKTIGGEALSEWRDWSAPNASVAVAAANADCCVYALALVGKPALKYAVMAMATASTLLATSPRFRIKLLMTSPWWRLPALRARVAAGGVDPVMIDEVSGVRCNRTGSLRPEYFEPTYTLFAPWNMTRYSFVLYLDSDLAVVRNLDAMLVHPPSVVELRTPRGCEPCTTRGMNTGVWGVRPDAARFHRLVHWMRTNVSHHPCGLGFQTAAWIYFAHGSAEVPFGVESTPAKSLRCAGVGANLKADTGVSGCMRRHRLQWEQVGVVHWSGGRKPFDLRTRDAYEATALRAWQSAHSSWKAKLTGAV